MATTGSIRAPIRARSRTCPGTPSAILGLLPLLVLGLHGTEIERPLAIVMIGGLVTSTVFTLLALPTFYQLVHNLGIRWRTRRANR